MKRIVWLVLALLATPVAMAQPAPGQTRWVMATP